MLFVIYIRMFSLAYGEATWRLRRLISLVFACLVSKDGNA